MSPTAPPSPDLAEPGRVQVLDLDQNLKVLAIRESVTLLDAILSRLPIHSELHSISRRARLRLTYVLLREPIPPLERVQLIALQRHDQAMLAQSLDRLPSTLSTLHRTP